MTHRLIHRIYPLLTALSVAVAITSCSGDKASPDQANIVDLTKASPLKVERLDRLVAEAPTLDNATFAALLDSMSHGAGMYLQLMGLPADSTTLTEGIVTMSASAPVRVFSPDVEQRVTTLDTLELQLGALNAAFGKDFPVASIKRVYSIVSPYRQGVITAPDSTVMIALNLYLGANYPGYKGFENYFRDTRQPSRIIYDVAEARLASAYPADFSSSATLLQQMLYQGALVRCLLATVPNADLASCVGVTPDQLAWMRQNEGNIWRAMMARDLVYSPSRLDASKLLDPAPSASIIHPDAPARVGRFIGYQIVNAYLQAHPETSLASLLTPEFYAGSSTLLDSKYNP